MRKNHADTPVAYMQGKVNVSLGTLPHDIQQYSYRIAYTKRQHTCWITDRIVCELRLDTKKNFSVWTFRQYSTMYIKQLIIVKMWEWSYVINQNLKACKQNWKIKHCKQVGKIKHCKQVGKIKNFNFPYNFCLLTNLSPLFHISVSNYFQRKWNYK